MKIGCTIWNESNNITDLIDLIFELEGNAFQTYLTPLNTSSAGKVITKEQSKDIREIIKNTGVYVVVHGKLIYNFCRTTEKWQIQSLVNELNKAHLLGNDVGVVIHQGKNVLKLSNDDAIINYVNNIKEVLDLTHNLTNPLYLENSCKQGTEIGYTLNELSIIWKMLKSLPDFRKNYENRLGFCLDTCHIFVSGELKFSSIDEVDSFFVKFDKLIGIKYLKLVHYNDSKCKFDGHNDSHDDITMGYISNISEGGNLEAFKRVVAWTKKYDIPLILETPMRKINCKDQINIIREWSNEEITIPLPVINKKKIVIKKVKR